MNNLIKSRFYPYVIAGGAALDSQSSGWYDAFTCEEINQLLDMNTHSEDVLGLLEAKGFSFDLSHYDPTIGMRAVDDDSEGYAELTEAWREYITLRRHLPDVPDGHAFIGAGGVLAVLPDPQPDAHCACYGDENWRPIKNANVNDEALYYCVHGSYAEQYINAMKKEYRVVKDGTEAYLILHDDDGVNYRGYWLTENDINRLMNIVETTHRLQDAGFDVTIDKVSVGCMEFTRSQLQAMHREYKRLKREAESGFNVTAGDRVRYLPAHEVYIVASVAAQEYILISTSSGNRWNDKRVISENYKAIPFKQFLTNGQNIEKWIKES